MSEMVERVARALAWHDLCLNADADELNRAGVTKEGISVDEAFFAAARSAIEAMREPTYDVSEIMNKHASNGMVNWRDYHAAMVDAALSTPEPK